MSLHRKHDSGRKASDVIYASSDLSPSVPKYKIPRDERAPRTPTLSSMTNCCSTATRGRISPPSATPGSSPRCTTLMDECIDKNMIDKDEYPQTAEIEAAASTCWPICGTRPTAQTPSAAPPPAPAKRRCSAVWPRSGAGARNGARRASPPTSRTWSAARCRSAGTSSAAISMSKSARSRSKATAC